MSPRKPSKLFTYLLTLPELEIPYELEVRYSKPKSTKLREESCLLHETTRGSFQIDSFTLYFKDKTNLTLPSCEGPDLEKLIHNIFLAVKLFLEDNESKYTYRKYIPRKLSRLTPGYPNWNLKNNCSVVEFAFLESSNQWVARPSALNHTRISVDDQTFKEYWTLYKEDAFKKREQALEELRTLFEQEILHVSQKYVDLVDKENEKFLTAGNPPKQEAAAPSFQQVLEKYSLPLDASS